MLRASLAIVFLLLVYPTASHGFACGNGIVEPAEQCDDGNTTSGDGCSATCQLDNCSLTGTWRLHIGLGNGDVALIEDGNHDIRGVVQQASTSTPALISGMIADGQLTLSFFDSECSTATSACETAFFLNEAQCSPNLPWNATFTKVAPTVCGDGHIDPSEQCDDGNFINGDGCSVVCLPEQCGNGIVEVNEQCDDGNRVNGDTCDNNCTYATCGNRIVDPHEQCDDGNANAGDACDGSCGIPGCPNGTVGAGEQCDDGNLTDNDGCARNCRLPGCGNLIVENGEECDDGNQVGGDGCTAACRLEPLPGCGDGSRVSPEECDDGNTTNCDGCSSSCHVERCGNGLRECGEECDDGNQVGGDGCSRFCVVEQPATCADSDGDGEPDEVDRCPGTLTNAVDGDGCSLPEFCARFDATTRDGARACRKADWKNDEPAMKAKEADCVVDKGSNGPEDDRCVPSVLP